MRKFLSILMLACLLALGMALPAAAEGTELYAQFEDSDEKVKELTIPADLRKEVFFFTKEGDSYKPVTSIPAAADPSVVEITKEPNVSPLVVTGKAAGVAEVALRDSEGNPMSDTVKINVLESHLEIKRRSETNWGTSLNNVRVNESVDVAIRLGANDDFEDWTTKTTPSAGLTRRGEKIMAETAGIKYLTYNQYSVSVMVSENEIQMPSGVEFLAALNNQEEFDRLIDGKYFGGGLTIVLPAEDLGSVVCSARLPDGGAIHLKGVSGTEMMDLTVHDGNYKVEDITFTGNGGISLHSVNQCEVRNCSFRGVPFDIYTDSNGIAPLLKLTDNNYFATDFANVYDNQNVLMGTWRVTGNQEPEGTAWYLGHYAWYKSGSQVLAFSFDVDDSVKSLSDKGWKFEFRHPCAFDSAYSAKDGTAYDGKFEANADPKTYVMSISEGGKYAVISGSYPQVVNNTVTIREVDKEYLSEVTVDTTLSAASVTHNGKQVFASVNNKKLTFYLDGAGTYKITATTATTTTKTKTTGRSYKYTYQDYYRVTPAGFTNAMRNVKDNLVTLNCTEAGRRSVSLPVDSLAAAAEKGYSVLVKTKNAELTLDAAALKSIAQQAKGTTVLLHYRSLNHKTLTTVGQASVQSHLAQFPGDNADLAFLVTATSDSETIDDLQMGSITLKIPFIVLPGTEQMENVAFALQSESIAEARETSVADGYLTTKLLDLTEHMVFLTGAAPQTTEETTEATEETTVSTEETTGPTGETIAETTQPAQPAEETGGSGILTVVIVFGAVLLIGSGALGFLLLRKRFRK